MAEKKPRIFRAFCVVCPAASRTERLPEKFQDLEAYPAAQLDEILTHFLLPGRSKWLARSFGPKRFKSLVIEVSNGR